MNRNEIERALSEAEEELTGLRSRTRELESLIARAYAALGRETPSPHEDRLTLHAALERILSDNGNEWMTVRELADAVNRSGLYVKRDGSKVESNQVHARTKNYEAMFEKERGRVRLRQGGKGSGDGDA